ncbi:MAG: primosomal protein N' [Sphingobacteriales bacterium]|nr:primosomal protein N' [Sphingobacteriales bacterium]
MYAEIILPLALPQIYTFAVPAALQSAAQVGCRAEVPFGKQKVYAGLIARLSPQLPEGIKPKAILSILDEKPLLHPIHLQLWQWIANYYMCSVGEVMHAALPAAFKLSGESILSANPLFSHDLSLLSDDEYLIAEALQHQAELSPEQIRSIVNKKNIYPLIRSLLDKGVVLVKEELQELYKPKTATFVRLQSPYSHDEEALRQLFDELAKAPKQLELLMAYWQLSKSSQQNDIAKSKLLQRTAASDASLKSLVEKKVFALTEKKVDRLADSISENIAPISYELNDSQQRALQLLQQHLEEKNIALLHGVTSSGKTQVYIELLRRTIEQGKQALFLLPEIALTAQMISRLKKVFGDKVGIYHSKFNDAERVEIWNKVLNKEYQIVLGARSALFLPFSDLGLIVVDEEHDSSYKQFDPAPRYQARDVAVYMGTLFQSKVLLGSASPSIESYANAAFGRYGLVEMAERYGGVQPPTIELIDLSLASVRQQMVSLFSKPLLDAIKDTLASEEQVILFKNRRGYAPFIMCNDCNAVPKCARCDVSLTYHKNSHILKCHYCGYQIAGLSQCPDCDSTHLREQGFGTEKIEDELQLLLPEVHLGRLDFDTAQSKTGFSKIISDFEQKKTHILVGTQMVTKGLDFDNVGLVGILSADQLIHFPNFRAAERAFQLMLQVSGRAGRRDKQGKVLIQTTLPAHPLFEYLQSGDFKNFYIEEVRQRQQWHYPPYTRLINITLKHKNRELLNDASFIFAEELRRELKDAVLGPISPLISRIRNFYLREITLKLPRDPHIIRTGKAHLQTTMQRMQQDPKYKSVITQLDIDPM